jgi:two-component system CheB/CheR fusion protein
MVLKYKGHEVRVAYSGVEAIQAVEVYVPDLVLLDLGMPGMDGFEVSRQLRKTPGLEHTVLAALTGWGQDDHRKKTASAGFDHHLTKPLEPQALEILLAEIHRSLSKA